MSILQLSNEERAKLLLYPLTGLAVHIVANYQNPEPTPTIDYVRTAVYATVIYLIIGLIVYGIKRLFGKPKTKRSFLGYLVYYGFFIVGLSILRAIFYLVIIVISML